jgi:hypothetical protein
MVMVGFDLRKLVVAYGLSEDQVLSHAALRLAHKYGFLNRHPHNQTFAAIEDGKEAATLKMSSSSSSSSSSNHYMCEESVFVKWVEHITATYDASNPYHNSLHAADVMLTANSFLDASLQV